MCQIVKCKPKPTTFACKTEMDWKLKLKDHFEKRDLFFSSVPSDRMREPTREGMRTAVLRLGRGHAGHDTLDTSRVFWVKR